MDTTKIKELLNVDSDEAIEQAITNLIDSRTELQNKVTASEQAEAEAKNQEIAAYITAAETAGKITAEVKDSLITLAKTDFDSVKKIVDAAKPAPLSNIIEPGEPVKPKMTKEEARKIYDSWKVKNLVATKANDEPELYNEVRTALKS